VPSEPGNILVVDVLDVVDAECTNLAARHEPPAATASSSTGPVPAVAITTTTGREPRTALAALWAR
jgi:hypothetical protein